MRNGIIRLACMGALLSFAGTIATASPALATEPSHGTATFDFTTPDAFGSFPTGDPDASQCSFPVTGTWTLRLDWTVWFYTGTDTPKMEIDRITILDGSFSNPLTGKSVPDLYHSDFQKFTYAPDGSLVGFFENESRNDPYDHMAGHFVYDATGAVVKDVGRDVLPENKHPMDITPLCDALS
jgi:hypothetical protein